LAQATCRWCRKFHSQELVMTMLVSVVATLMVGTAGAMELTKETWDAAVSGKTLFVKFLAPW